MIHYCKHRCWQSFIQVSGFEPEPVKVPLRSIAAYATTHLSIEASRKDPDRVFKTNLIGTFNILKKCVRDNANIIFLSSSRVYSINKLRSFSKNLNISRPLKVKRKIDENFETTTASSLYGFTKLASEKLICEIFFNTKLKYIINRF